MRGMTALPNDELVFSWKEPNYTIERLVPEDGKFQPTIELDVYKYMAAVWGVNPLPHMIIGYNDMPEFVHPYTQERVNLVGLFAIHPSGEGNPLATVPGSSCGTTEARTPTAGFTILTTLYSPQGMDFEVAVPLYDLHFPRKASPHSTLRALTSWISERTEISPGSTRECCLRRKHQQVKKLFFRAG